MTLNQLIKHLTDKRDANLQIGLRPVFRADDEWLNHDVVGVKSATASDTSGGDYSKDMKAGDIIIY